MVRNQTLDQEGYLDWFVGLSQTCTQWTRGTHYSQKDFDNRATLLKISVMEITLTEDLQRFVEEKVRKGGYADANEVISDALRYSRAKEDPAELDSQELAELLLPAVRGSHEPLTDEDFERLRSRARTSPAGP